MYSAAHHPKVQIPSATDPGVLYDVEDGRCTCKGFQYRHICSHIRAAQKMLALDPDPAPKPQPVRPSLRVMLRTFTDDYLNR